MQQIHSDEQDLKNSLALVKILAIAAIKLKGGRIVDLKTNVANKLWNNAKSFWEEYNDGDSSVLQSLWDNILKKSTTLEPIVMELVPQLRRMMRENNLKNQLDVISTNTKEVLNPLLAFFTDHESLNKFDAVVRKSQFLREPAITNKMIAVFKELSDAVGATPDIQMPTSKAPSGGAQSMATLITQIEALGKQITGRKGVTKLSQEEKVKYNAIDKNKPLIRDFNALRSQLTNVKRNEIRNIVASSGQNQITVKAMVSALKAEGLPISIPAGIQKSTIVYVNTNGEYCDRDGRVLAKQTADPGATWEDNPGYVPGGGKGQQWVVKVTTPAGANYYGTKERVGQNKAAKFGKVDQVLESGIESAKAAWRADMDGDPDKELTVYANIMEYMFWTASRVGAGEGSTGGERTYGASNFLRKHITNLPRSGSASRLEIRYPVKSGAEITFNLSSNLGDLPSRNDGPYMKQLIAFICTKAKGKKPDEVVFTINGKRINTDKLNSYAKAKLGGLTVHGMRALRGSELSIVALNSATEHLQGLIGEAEKKGKKLPQKTVDEVFDTAMKAVGELLGHVRRTGDEGEEVTTSSTAIRSYCAPKIMLDFYKNINYAPNARVITAARSSGLTV